MTEYAAVDLRRLRRNVA